MLLQTTVEIGVPPQKVWEVLTAFSSYEKWHPLLRLSEDAGTGLLTYARRLSLKSDHWIETQAEIVENSPPRRLSWRYGMRGVFATEESFELEATGGGTTVTHRVGNRGVLALLVAPIANRKLRASVDLFDGLLARHFAKRSEPPKSLSRSPANNRAARRRSKRR